MFPCVLALREGLGLSKTRTSSQLFIGRCDFPNMDYKSCFYINHKEILYMYIYKDIPHLREAFKMKKESVENSAQGSRFPQIGNHPSRWDITGVMAEKKDFDQYVINVDGSGRLKLRNRKITPFQLTILLLLPQPRVLMVTRHSLNNMRTRPPAPSTIVTLTIGLQWEGTSLSMSSTVQCSAQW